MISSHEVHRTDALAKEGPYFSWFDGPDKVVLTKNIKTKGRSIQLRITPETGFIGVWIKQTKYTCSGRAGRVGVTESGSDSHLCIVYIITQHSTHYASKVVLTL